MKVLLNCLPPADIHTPSNSLSPLKKFMNENSIETKIKIRFDFVNLPNSKE